MTAENVVPGRFRLDADNAGLVIAVMREARIRTGKRREEFAQAVNRRSGRPLRLDAASIEAYETGYALPVADVLFIALALGGMDLPALLTRWLYG